MRLDSALPAGIVATGIASTLVSRERRSAPRRAADRRQQTLAHLAHWLVERESQPLFVVDSTLNVMLSNRAARELLRTRKWLKIHLGKLQCRQESHQRTLNHAARAAKHTTFQLTQRAPIMRLTPIPDDPTQPFLLALCIDRDPDASPTPCMIQHHFHLTPAEAEVAIEMLNGTSLVTIARKRRSSINTVKTQARHVFQKCRVRSRVELVRKVNIHTNRPVTS